MANVAWTESRVVAILREILLLQENVKVDEVVELRKENARLLLEVQETGRRHLAAMKDLQDRGEKMEKLMRQLLEDRTRLMLEVSSLQEAKVGGSNESKSEVLLNLLSLNTDVGVQVGDSDQCKVTVERGIQVTAERDAESPTRPLMCSENVGLSSSASLQVEPTTVVFVYEVVPPTSISYSRGAEDLALVLFACGRWIDNVKLDVCSPDWVFVGINLDGWWHWRRQESRKLNIAASVIRAFNDEGGQLWWCAALASALIDLNTDHNMTVADFLVAGCGCTVGSHITLNATAFSHMVNLLTAGPWCCIIARGVEMTYGSSCDVALIVSVSFTGDDEALFYVVRGGGDTTNETEDASVMGHSCTLVGELLSSQQLLERFNVIQIVECVSLQNTSEIRWPDVVDNHFASVAIRLHVASALGGEYSVRARFLDSTTSSWWAMEVVSRGDDVFALYSPHLRHATSVVIVLHVDIGTVGRVDFLHALPDGDPPPSRERIMIVQVDGQEVCSNGVTVNATLEREAAGRAKKNAGGSLSRAEVNVTTISDYCVALVNLVADHLWKSSEALLEGLLQQQPGVPCEAKKLLLAAHLNTTASMNLVVDYTDSVFELLVTSWSPPRHSNKVNTAEVSSPMLPYCIVARKNIELQLLKSRNTYVTASLSRVSLKLQDTMEKLASATHDGTTLQMDLARCASAFGVLRRTSLTKDAQLSEAKRYCCAVEEELRKANENLLDLRASISHLQSGHPAVLFEESSLVPFACDKVQVKEHSTLSTMADKLF